MAGAMDRKIAAAFLALSIFSFGLYLGGRGQYPAEDLSSVLKPFRGKIAVVNLDEGVGEGAAKICYAKTLIDYDDKSYVSTSLSEARDGIREGRLAAYLVIPASFSRSVESINKRPDKATISYALSPSLDPEREADTVLELRDFQSRLNANTSYLYVRAILRDFHEAQDESKIILKNDEKELKDILSLEVEPLWEPLFSPSVSELGFPEETEKAAKFYPALDLASSAGELLTENLERSVRGFLDAREDYDRALKEISNALDRMEERETEHTDRDEERNTAEEQDLSRSDSDRKARREERELVEEKLRDLLENQRVQDQRIAAEELGRILPKLQEIVRNENQASYLSYQREADRELQRIQNENQRDLSRASEIYQSSLSRWLYQLQSSTPSVIPPASSSVLMGPEAHSFPALLISTASNLEDGTSLPPFPIFPCQTILKTAVGALDPERSPEQNVFLTLSAQNAAELPKQEITLPPLLKQDSILQKSAESIFSAVHSAGEEEEGEGHVQRKERRTAIGESSRKKEKLDEMRERLRSLTEGQGGEAGIFSYHEGEALKSAVHSFREEREQEEHTMELREQEAMKYEEGARDAAERCMDAASSALSEAESKSAENIDSMIDSIRESKERSHRENSIILKAFSEKLSYTRLGTLEHTEAYDFMVNPVKLQRLGDEEPEYGGIRGDRRKSGQHHQGAFYLAIGSLAASAGIFFAGKRLRKRRRKL